MAYTGMRHPVFAPVESYTPGQSIIYGQGVVLGKAIDATITPESANAELYADNELAESDNSMIGATIAMTVDDLMHETGVIALGLKKRTVNGKTAYSITSKASPYGCVGWLEEKVLEGAYSFIVKFAHRVQLSRSTMNSATKGRNLTYQTVPLSGRVLPAELDESREKYWIDEIPVETEAEGLALLDELAHVSAEQSAAVEEEDDL